MRYRWLAAAALAAIAIAAAPVLAQAQEACHVDRYGTTVDWHKDYDKACQIAAKEGKPLFVIHISGDLPDPKRT